MPLECFLWPNDLRFGPDDHLYLTDSGILDTDFIEGIRIVSHYETLPYDGCVYQIDPVAGRVVRRIDSGIRKALRSGPTIHSTRTRPSEAGSDGA